MNICYKIICTAAVTAVFATPVLAANLCSSDETKMFECGFEKSKKSVSICQSSKNKKEISYRFGTSDFIEMSLPNEKSNQPYIHFEQFGPSSTQWVKQVIFPFGKTEYILNTPQGISALLLVQGIKKPITLVCETGDSGNEVSELYDQMEKLNFKKK